jgi:hypothetical protein
MEHGHHNSHDPRYDFSRVEMPFNFVTVQPHCHRSSPRAKPFEIENMGDTINTKPATSFPKHDCSI